MSQGSNRIRKADAQSLASRISRGLNDRREKPSVWIAKQLVGIARAGGTEAPVAAREILHELVRTVDAHDEEHWSGPIPYVSARYLADVFSKILDPKTKGSASRSLIKASRGRPAGRGKGVKYDHGALVAAYRYLIRLGYRPAQAVACLEDKTNADRRTIQKQAGKEKYKMLKDPRLPDDVLRILSGVYWADIQAIIAVERKPSRI